MGASADEIDRQINETRDHIDENLGVLERRAATSAMRYGRLAAVVLGVVALAGAGVLVYRRIYRPSRRAQLQGMLIEALKDLPDTLRDLPDEVTARLKKPLPSIKVVVHGKGEAKEPGTVESIVRKVAPALVTTASGALIDRFTRQSDPLDEKSSRFGVVPAFD
jgi:hypothetical protein